MQCGQTARDFFASLFRRRKFTAPVFRQKWARPTCVNYRLSEHFLQKWRFGRPSTEKKETFNGNCVQNLAFSQLCAFGRFRKMSTEPLGMKSTTDSSRLFSRSGHAAGRGRHQKVPFLLKPIFKATTQLDGPFAICRRVLVRSA